MVLLLDGYDDDDGADGEADDCTGVCVCGK